MVDEVYRIPIWLPISLALANSPSKLLSVGAGTIVRNMDGIESIPALILAGTQNNVGPLNMQELPHDLFHAAGGLKGKSLGLASKMAVGVADLWTLGTYSRAVKHFAKQRNFKYNEIVIAIPNLQMANEAVPVTYLKHVFLNDDYSLPGLQSLNEWVLASMDKKVWFLFLNLNLFFSI